MPKKKSITKAQEGKKTKGGLMLNPAQSPLSAKQLLHILQKTPKNHIYSRQGKGSSAWDYVTGVYVKKVLNYVFGWMWNFEVVEHGREGDLVWVLGKLTINTNKGSIVKTQFGRAEVKYLKGKPRTATNTLDFGNDLKAATTDALKKCASELGIASDIYGKQEFREIQKEDKAYIPPENNNGGANQSPPPTNPKLIELKAMLKGETAAQKLVDITRRSGLKLDSFKITEKHAGIVIAALLNSEVKQ